MIRLLKNPPSCLTNSQAVATDTVADEFEEYLLVGGHAGFLVHG
jgi:hypothetical protein